MVELRMGTREMGGDGVNHHEKLGLERITCASQFTIPNTAGSCPDPACTYIDTRYSQPNQARCTPDISYPLVSSTSFSSSSSSLSFSSTTLPSSQNAKLSHLSLSLDAMIMSWHQVQHTPSTASIEYSIHRVQHPHKIVCLPFILMITSWPLNVAASSGMASLHDLPPSASSPWELKGKVTLSHHHACKSTNWWIDYQHPARRPLTVSKFSSNLARSSPPQCITKLAWLRPPSSHNHALQVHLQTRSITASKWISKLAHLGPPSLHDHGLQVHLQTRSIMISECIYKFTRSRHPGVSPNTLDYRLQVHLQTCTISPLGCISEFTQSWFSGTPQIALKHRHLQPVRIYHV